MELVKDQVCEPKCRELVTNLSKTGRPTFRLDRMVESFNERIQPLIMYSVDGDNQRITLSLAGFELDRKAPERCSGFFLNRNGVPVHFFENSERKSDSCCCVHTSKI